MSCPVHGDTFVPMNIETVSEFWANFDFDTAKPITIGCEKVICLRTFVNTHISYLKHNKGNPTYLPYWLRIEKLTKHYAQKH